MAERDYLQAALPDRITLLGQSLRPFALGHLMLLARSENCFVLQPLKPPTLPELLNDLVIGVFICCQNYEDACEALNSRWLVPQFKVWMARLGEFDVIEKAKAFRQYIADGSKPPDLWEPESDAVRFPGAPFVQRVRIILQAKLNHSLSEAWNKPWGEAIHDYFGFWEIEDRAKIINDDERALIADQDGSMAALDSFLQTEEFKNFLALAVAAEPEQRPQPAD